MWQGRLATSDSTHDALYEVVRIDGKLQLSTRTEYIVTRSGTVQGISLEVYGMFALKYDKTTLSKKAIRKENVSYSTSRAEQERILRAMCDIVAVQAQAEYRLLYPIKTLPAYKARPRPKKGKYG